MSLDNGIWGKFKKTPEAALSKKEEREPLQEFARRFQEQAHKALSNMVLVGSVQARIREIDAASADIMSGKDDGTLDRICGEIARQNPHAFPDILDDLPNSKERKGYVYALANELITQTSVDNNSTIH
jgi:hypothetical protein